MGNSHYKNKRRHSHRMNRFKDRIAGRIMTAILLLASITFVVLLIATDLLPMIYIGMILVALMVLVIIDYLLVMKIRKKIRFIIGVILFLIVIGVLGIGGSYIYKTYSTLHKITSVNTETTEVNVFVKEEDPASNIAEAKTYNYGILSYLDREKTDQAIDQLKLEIGEDMQITEYEGLTDLADAILKDRCQAIILNRAYLDILNQMSGYEDFENSIRAISSKKVKTQVEKRVQKYTSDPVQQSEQTKKEVGDVYTILISGIDSRGGLTASSLSDVNIIATVNTKTHQAILISTPRDFFVPLSISNGIPDKLTHAGIYGVNVCEDTLGMLYNIDIDYYFRLNFEGFIKIIDRLGGITIYSDYEFTTKNGSRNGESYHFNQGYNEVNGNQALGFCRERYSFAEGDRQRGRNQMAVIKAVVDKLLSPELLKNYMGILNETTGCFESNVPYDVIADLVKDQLTTNEKWSIFSYSSNGTGDTQKPYSMSQKAYVMIPDQSTVEKSKMLMEKVRNGEILTEEDVK